MSHLSKGEKTREKIISDARTLIIANGFHKTSISDIIAASGVKKGNLYYYFSSKEELGLTILNETRDAFFRLVDMAMQAEMPLDRIESLFNAILQEQKKSGFVGGCLFGNTALEMSDSHPDFAEVINDVFSQWAIQIEKTLDEAQTSGELDSAFSPPLLARLIVAAIEGGIMLARSSKKETDLEDCLAALLEILNR